MQHRYSIYGLRLGVDRALPALPRDTADARADVAVWTHDLPAWASRALSGERTAHFDSGDGTGSCPATVRVWHFSKSGAYQFAYRDGVGFVVDGPGERIAVTRAGAATLADATSYLVGVVLGFLLRLRSRMVLHASVVAIDEHAIAILGESGSGKSTTAAAFASMGHAILADDVCAPVENAGGFRIEPAYPGIRLWPETVKGIFGSETALPRISPGWDKRLLELSNENYRFQSESLPVGALYWLKEPGNEHATTRVHRLRARERLMKLLPMSYPRYLLDGEMRVREFDGLARLACDVPGAVVEAPSNLGSVPDICRAIVDDYRAASGASRCN